MKFHKQTLLCAFALAALQTTALQSPKGPKVSVSVNVNVNQEKDAQENQLYEIRDAPALKSAGTLSPALKSAASGLAGLQMRTCYFSQSTDAHMCFPPKVTQSPLSTSNGKNVAENIDGVYMTSAKVGKTMAKVCPWRCTDPNCNTGDDAYWKKIKTMKAQAGWGDTVWGQMNYDGGVDTGLVDIDWKMVKDCMSIDGAGAWSGLMFDFEHLSVEEKAAMEKIDFSAVLGMPTASVTASHTAKYNNVQFGHTYIKMCYDGAKCVSQKDCIGQNDGPKSVHKFMYSLEQWDNIVYNSNSIDNCPNTIHDIYDPELCIPGGDQCDPAKTCVGGLCK